jgi:phosphoribosylaminoimidazole (AIR) synthetase
MYRVFNMGIGMLAIVAREDVQKLQEMIAEETWVIGKLVSGDHKVRLV